MKFVDVKNDVAFRKIFGNENKKIILISFIGVFANGIPASVIANSVGISEDEVRNVI